MQQYWICYVAFDDHYIVIIIDIVLKLVSFYKYEQPLV